MRRGGSVSVFLSRMTDMRWIRQTPFLAVLVFGIGAGLGFAWKTGWIPVELGTANTGTIGDAGSLEDADSTTSATADTTPVPAELPPDDPRFFTAQSEPAAPEMAVAVNETKSLDRPRRPVRTASTSNIRSAIRPERVAPADHAADEFEWAAEPTGQPTANQAGKVQAGGLRADAVPPRTIDTAQQPTKPIRLVANQEPSARGIGEPATEPSTEPPRSARPPNSLLAEDLKAADEQIANDEILPAHRALSKLYWNHKEARGELLPRLEQTARAIFFEPRPHFVDPYVVQANDQLRVIASQHQLSWEYLAKLNRTDPRRIQLGQKLKILKGPFAAVIDLGDFALTIHLQGYYVKRYPVGIGKDGASPVGKFTVLNKIENPQYTSPDGKVISGDDPANPLGERWIDLGESYGIHGTIDPDSIGRAASRGCIRMREKDVIEVYDFLVKGSEVVIRK